MKRLGGTQEHFDPTVLGGEFSLGRTDMNPPPSLTRLRIILYTDIHHYIIIQTIVQIAIAAVYTILSIAENVLWYRKVLYISFLCWICNRQINSSGYRLMRALCGQTFNIEQRFKQLPYWSGQYNPSESTSGKKKTDYSNFFTALWRCNV